MYKLLLTLFTFISVSMVANSQLSMDISSTDYNKWFFTNQGGNGVSSYYAQVTTDGNKSSDGLYYYNIYFYTNSRYNDGTLCSTYITDLNFYIWNGSKWVNVLYLDYVLAPPPSKGFNGMLHAAYVYAPYRINYIRITWSNHVSY